MTVTAVILLEKESTYTMKLNFKQITTSILAAFTMMFAFASCQEKEEIKAELTLYANDIQFSAQNETKTVKYKSNGTLSFFGDYDWLTVTNNDTHISITTEENPANEFRNATITVRATVQGGDYKELSIKIRQDSKSGVPVGAVAIKDPNFAEYIIKYFDRNQDGHLQNDEAALIKEIDISDYDQTVAPIRTLEGIEHFKNLEVLYCMHAGIQGVVDLSGLSKLNHIECDHNEITELKIAKCPAINSLICEFNSIEKLDLQSAGCTGLQFFNCQGNKLKSLDCSGFTRLQHLYCAMNPELSTLKTTGLSAMTTLACHKTNLTSIKLQDMPGLSYVQANDSKLVSLDLKGMDKLEKIYVGNNYLQALDVTPAPKLTVLECSGNALKTVDGLAGLNNLINFNCSNNLFKTIVLTGKRALKEVNISFNKLESLTLSDCPNITSIVCNGTGLKTLDVAAFANLQKLECEKNELTTLDVSSNLKLETLYARNNKLTELWLAQGQKIKDLKVDNKGVIKYKGAQQSEQGSQPGKDANIYDYTETF